MRLDALLLIVAVFCCVMAFGGRRRFFFLAHFKVEHGPWTFFVAVSDCAQIVQQAVFSLERDRRTAKPTPWSPFA